MSGSDRAQRILESLNTAIVTCDQELAVTFANPAAEMLFGLSASQLVTRPVAGLFGGHEHTVVPLTKVMESGQAITVHGVRLVVASGDHITVDYTATPLPRGKNNERVIVELVRVDRFLKLAREETWLDARVAKRAVLRGLAHEIKNPLGGLRGAAQLLDRELKHRSQREYTRIIVHEADRLRNLVDRMTEPYRPLTLEPVNIHQLLEHVRKLTLVENPNNLVIQRDYDPSLPDLKGDREQLIQALLNVVRNAVQAMQGRGRLYLRTRIERVLSIGQTQHRQVLRVDIEDDGPGIPKQLGEQIFYPLVTGRADGTGLGLSITQDIVGRHGGLVQFTSEPGHTCFSVYLPFNGSSLDNESSLDR